MKSKLFNPFIILRNQAPGEGDSGGGGAPPPAGAGDTPAPASSQTPPAPGNPPPSTPAGIVNPDGSFAPNWHQHADFTGMPGLDKFSSVKALATSYKELERKLGQGTQSGPPGADAPPEALAAYREAHGIPADPTGYQLKPEQLPDGVVWSDDAGKHFASIFHANHVPANVAKSIVEGFTKFEAEQARQIETAYQNRLAEGEQKLRNEWGASYDARLQSVKEAVARLGYDPNDKILFSDPKVVGFLGAVVDSLTPDSLAGAKGTVATGGQYQSGKDEARAIISDPNHPDHKRYYEGDPEVVKKVARLASTY